MRVLHILNELRYSGLETMLAAAAPWFLTSGMEATVLATGQAVGPFADQLRMSGYSVEHIPFHKSIQFFLSVRRLIRNGHFDIVHIQCERAYPLYAAMAWPTPTIRTTHHIFQFHGALRIRKIVERAVCRMVFGVTQTSSSISEQRNERRRFYSDTHLVPNWYDDSRFRTPSPKERSDARDLLGLGKDEFLFVSLGSNVEYKNYELIIGALQFIPAQFPIKYLHIGEEGPGEPLSALADKLQVRPRTIFPGRVEDAIRYLWASDCYVMPSREEGFGIAAVEAMAAGLPAILSRRPALTDFGRYLDGIIYVEPRVEDLALQMLLMYFRSPAERSKTATQLAAGVRSYFGAQTGARGYLSVYESVIARSKGISTTAAA